jgi:hypothetical protein
MPLIDVICTACGLVSEVNRPLSMWPATPPCPKCDGLTDRHWTLSGVTTAPAVVAYRMPDGSFRFPGRPDSPITKQYESQGGTRLELRGWAEVRRFEGEVNGQQKAQIQRRVERQLRQQEAGTRIRRSELYNQLQSMSESARLFARALIRYNDSQPNKIKEYDPGFRVEAYSETRSNREESRDERGRRQRD